MKLSPQAKTKLFNMCEGNPRVAKALIRYVEEREAPGDFLECLLSNDLFLTISKHDGLTSIKGIIRWLYNNTPGNCWGSRENYRGWISANK